MTELKPCPFCGGKRVNVAEIAGNFFEVCGTRGAEGKQMATISDAICMWNNRAGDVPERKAVNVGEVSVFPNAKAESTPDDCLFEFENAAGLLLAAHFARDQEEQ